MSLLHSRPCCTLLRCGFRMAAISGLVLLALLHAHAAEMQSTAGLKPAEVGGSLLRLFGALVFVIALFLGGAWAYRNLDRFTGARRRAAKLTVLEARSLGNRHALYVVGYEKQRLLVSASPSGVSLLTPLPDGEEAPATVAREEAPSGFAVALERLLAGRGERAS